MECRRTIKERLSSAVLQPSFSPPKIEISISVEMKMLRKHESNLKLDGSNLLIAMVWGAVLVTHRVHSPFSCRLFSFTSNFTAPSHGHVHGDVM
jgi:hypothetical protein